MDASMKNQIREHMMVHAQDYGSIAGVPGEHIGTVDYIEGNHILLTNNESPDGRYRSIPMSLVERVEGNTVLLNCDARTVYEEWETVEGSETNPQAAP